MAGPRPLYWSLRRELWENRSIYLAPLGVAAFAVAGLAIHGVTMPSHMPGMLGTDPSAPGSASVTYRVPAMLMLATAFFVGAFYCLDALSGERGDRSILFWKSLPVSDRAAVLAKAGVPLLVLPLLTFVVIVAMHALMLLLSVAALAVQGHGAGALWSELRLFRLWLLFGYAVVAMTLWLAPVYGLLLLVSARARRMAALWAVLPFLALAALEKLSFNTTHTVLFVADRVAGWYPRAFGPAQGQSMPFHPAAPPTPGRFFASPDLWIGLVLAALAIAAAVRLRRYQDPS